MQDYTRDMTECERGRRRVVIEGVRPEIDGGRFPIKRAIGEKVIVEADIFADGHDSLSCVLKYHREGNEGRLSCRNDDRTAARGACR